jgi:hypothetical protein
MTVTVSGVELRTDLNQKNNVMAGKTYVEKILEAPVGEIVFRKPDLVLTHPPSKPFLEK